MKIAARRTTTAIAAFATVGVSSVFAGAIPAAAAPSEACGLDGTVVAPGVCELVITGDTTFIRTAQMTQLEVLLVGAGGASSDQPVPMTNGYAAAGGGGQVAIVDYSSGTTDLDITVAQAGVASASSSDDGGTLTSVGNGADASTSNGGASGNGNPGSIAVGTNAGAGGGGAAGSPTTAQDGGAGVVAGNIAAPGSLFTGDARCFGGGGAASTLSVTGVATCGGGYGLAGGTSLIAPVANSGGGAGGTSASQTLAARTGANGVAIVRWTAANVTLSFNANGHGSAPAPQVLAAGAAATVPATPTAAGFQFNGWFTDASLTTPANFSAPVTASTTYFASWGPLLAATGVDVSPLTIPFGFGAIVLGAVLVVMNRRRRQA